MIRTWVTISDAPAASQPLFEAIKKQLGVPTCSVSCSTAPPHCKAISACRARSLRIRRRPRRASASHFAVTEVDGRTSTATGESRSPHRNP